MKWTNLFMLAYRALGKNKLRTFLTMLGIIIGVASVIAMLAIGQGSKENIKSQISSLGNNVMIITPGSGNQGGVRGDAGSSSTLTLEDALAIKKRCALTGYVTPLVLTKNQVVNGSKNWRSSIYGVYTDYFYIRNLTITDGTSFTMTDERNAAKVCLIGQTVVNNLFDGENPVGKTIRIKNIPFKIIGLLDKKGQNSFGQDQDDVVIAPFSTIQKRMLANTFVNQILASAVSEDQIPDASNEIFDLLCERHKISGTKEADFTIRTQTEIANIIGATTKVLTVLLAIIASISLLVGGIGIMNIMYVSVTERTKEIGLRMALGARGKDVLLQFLFEAVLISLIGGLIGILLGVLIAQMVSGIMKWPVMVSSSSVLLSFFFSMAIGIFFGWYPARKAAQLNPIEALRYE